MSDYPKNQAWSGIWDALYWRFVHVHRHFFQGNPRLAIMPAMFDKFEESKKQLLLHTAKEFLDKLI
jgi:deoxyribodipyrimidine photolyase-related protein